ncbi:MULTISPECIES: phosphonate metabolism transcriptional regulator PhnF [Planktothrix]|nr:MULTISPECIES: phosphonate metabolism transcriptional regulator PhnF [Planktothrix]
MSLNPVPMHLQVAERIRHNIKQGIYRVGEQLPQESLLSQCFNVNRHIIRRAIACLKSEGVLNTEPGRGIFVTKKPIIYPLGKRVRYNEILINQGLEPSFQLLKCIEIKADLLVANHLEILVGESVAWIERLMFANNVPISITSSYFPLDYFPNLLAYEAQMWSISRLLREIYGCDHLRRNTWISSRLVDADDAQLLHISTTSSILRVESINVDQHNHIIEYGITRFRGDQIELGLGSQCLSL